MELFSSRKRSRISPDAPLAVSVAESYPHEGSLVGVVSEEKSFQSFVGFSSLGLSPWLVSSLSALGVNEPTPVQRACIPIAISGRDVIGAAPTGSGKTAAFAVPILHALGRDPWGIAALVLTPARELASQIRDAIAAFGAPNALRVVALTGGEDMTGQGLELATLPHIVVATPGRLAHVLSSGATIPTLLNRVATLVLDEADRLGEESFAPDIAVILSRLPKGRGHPSPSAGRTRQTLLFSATGPGRAKDIPGLDIHPEAFEFSAREASRENVKGPALPSTLMHEFIFIPSAVKHAYLLHALLVMGPSDLVVPTKGSSGTGVGLAGSAASGARGRGRAASAPTTGAAGSQSAADDASTPRARAIIVFASSCRAAALAAEFCVENGIPTAALHSALPQHARSRSLALFRGGSLRVLVATDVASRGLDLPAVDLVINFDVPRVPSDYVHRSGRTARAGRAGRALTLVTQYDVELVHALEDKALGGRKLKQLPQTLAPEKVVLARLPKVAASLELARARLIENGVADALDRQVRRKKESRAAREAKKVVE
jgi:ATP-dependent RNA helicase DDX49/DBP8